MTIFNCFTRVQVNIKMWAQRKSTGIKVLMWDMLHIYILAHTKDLMYSSSQLLQYWILHSAFLVTAYNQLKASTSLYVISNWRNWQSVQAGVLSGSYLIKAILRTWASIKLQSSSRCMGPIHLFSFWLTMIKAGFMSSQVFDGRIQFYTERKIGCRNLNWLVGNAVKVNSIILRLTTAPLSCMVATPWQVFWLLHMQQTMISQPLHFIGCWVGLHVLARWLHHLVFWQFLYSN